WMSADATLTYNGTSVQTIACDDVPGSGIDFFEFTNVMLNNAAGFIMEGPTYVTDELNLNSGIIQTTIENVITIADQAIISGGSANAYISGPLIKQGRTNGNDFLFPIGDAMRYAPLEISPVVTQESEYTAVYFSCPPPFGIGKGNGLYGVSGLEYWTFDKKTGSDQVDVRLFWTDASVSGIDEPDDLVLAYLDPSDVWQSAGNGGTTGGVGVGVGGSIVNDSSCPPPFGIRYYTFGTDSDDNALPVTLTSFTASTNGKHIELTWVTSSEINTSHFEVERSENGVDFVPFRKVNAQGNSDWDQYYQVWDTQTHDGDNFYRLRQVDLDGMDQYFDIIVVHLQEDKNSSPLLYPNPTQDAIQI
ncbi:MAG: hypothetical protein AAGD05_19725, partial [Bacteroidota bacterium]